MNEIVQFFRNLGPSRLAAMLAVTFTLVGFFAYIYMQVTTPQMVALFTDLTLSDSAAIVKELDQQAIPYELRRDGSSILVPRDKVAQLRMKLAESGLPSGGGVGYEIFDKGDGLSSTSFLQNVNRLRALEGELSRSIRSIDRIENARVHLVVPDKPLFSRDAAEPSASIVLKVRGDLGAGQAQAIRHLVASAVQRLQPNRISIVDEAGRLLANGGEEDGPGLNGAEEEKISGMESRIKNQIEGIVERIVGPGRARAEVRAEMDFSKITQTSDKFDPESRVARSTQTREENSENKESDGAVSVGAQLPNAQQGAQNGNQSKTNKTDETTNFEISRTTRTEVQEGARLKRMSVAVLVDGVYTTDTSGNVTYTPRTQEELDRISALVRTAIGYDQQRGDQIEVVNLRFAEAPRPVAAPDESGSALFGFTKDDLINLIQSGVLFIVTLLVLLIVVRPLLRRVLQSDQRASGGPNINDPSLTKEEIQALIAGAAPGTSAVQQGSAAPNVIITNAGGQQVESVASNQPQVSARMLALAQVSGQITAQTLHKVGELAQNNPAETVSVVRQWMSEGA